jgi:hypothetical protein
MSPRTRAQARPTSIDALELRTGKTATAPPCAATKYDGRLRRRIIRTGDPRQRVAFTTTMYIYERDALQAAAAELGLTLRDMVILGAKALLDQHRDGASSDDSR